MIATAADPARTEGRIIQIPRQLEPTKPTKPRMTRSCSRLPMRSSAWHEKAERWQSDHCQRAGSGRLGGKEGCSGPRHHGGCAHNRRSCDAQALRVKPCGIRRQARLPAGHLAELATGRDTSGESRACVACGDRSASGSRGRRFPKGKLKREKPPSPAAGGEDAPRGDLYGSRAIGPFPIGPFEGLDRKPHLLAEVGAGHIMHMLRNLSRFTINGSICSGRAFRSCAKCGAMMATA